MISGTPEFVKRFISGMRTSILCRCAPQDFRVVYFARQSLLKRGFLITSLYRDEIRFEFVGRTEWA
jgi:hypothetical protein